MRIDVGGARALACAALVCAAVFSCGTTRTRHGDRVDVSGYPAEIRAAYPVFALRCSRCHTLARPLNAQITEPEHWVRYVTRMRRNPGSGINRQDAELILRFLIYYTAHEKGASTSAPVLADAGAAPDPKKGAKP